MSSVPTTYMDAYTGAQLVYYTPNSPFFIPPQAYQQQQGHPYYQQAPQGNAPQATAPQATEKCLAPYPKLSEEQLKMPPALKQIAIPKFEVRDPAGAPIPPERMNMFNNSYGILHITHNPFNVRPNEVLACLGGDTRVVEYPQASGIYGVHIIQERQTGKTLDIFVEVVDWQEADRVLRRFTNLQTRRREGMIANRRIQMTMQSNSEMMRSIFPSAKCEWINGMPARSEAYVTNHPSEWDGFITNEELVKVQLFVEQPNSAKTRFAAGSPERVYQFMMTSLQKIPWTANRAFFPKIWVMSLHKLLHRMAVRLANLVKDQQHTTLDTKLLTQFMITIRSCPMYQYDPEDPKAYEHYMSIAGVVDKVMADGFKRPGSAVTTTTPNSTSPDPLQPSDVSGPSNVVFTQAGYTSVPRKSDEAFYAAYGKAAMKAALVEQLDKIATDAGVPSTPARKPPKKGSSAQSSASGSSGGVSSTGTTYQSAHGLPFDIPYFPVSNVARAKSATFSVASTTPFATPTTRSFITQTPSRYSDPNKALPRHFS